MASEPQTKPDAKVDKQLEHQLEVVNELSRDPSDDHPADVPGAPLTEHGETSGVKPLVDDLHERRAKIKLGGGAEKIDAQHAKGKLTARERVDLLVDTGTFVEIGMHGRPDFVPMVVGQGAMALAGPYLVKAVTGEDIEMEELGGAKVHCRKSGVGDLEVADDRECIEAIKTYLSFFPSNCEQQPPIRPTTDPVDRMDEELLDIVPESPRHPYDMYDVIARIVDDGEYFDIKPKWAKTIITCFARFGGRPVGIVASQPKQLAGILENDSADKAARFINLCDAFNIPLVFLQDVPGFMVGTKVEQEGIIRHGAKMLYSISRATVPKVTVVIRKAYGAGYYVMCGKAYEPDLIVAWPSAEISVMGPEGAVNIIFRKQIEASDDPDATRAEMIEGIQKIIDPYIAAGNAMVDDIIDPRETRPVVIRALEMAA